MEGNDYDVNAGEESLDLAQNVDDGNKSVHGDRAEFGQKSNGQSGGS